MFITSMILFSIAGLVLIATFVSPLDSLLVAIFSVPFAVFGIVIFMLYIDQNDINKTTKEMYKNLTTAGYTVKKDNIDALGHTVSFDTPKCVVELKLVPKNGKWVPTVRVNNKEFVDSYKIVLPSQIVGLCP